MPEITSRHHPHVRAFRQAVRGEGPARLLDGWHLLHEAADAGIEISTVALCGAPPTPRDRALVDRLARVGTVTTVSRSVMDAISPVRTPVGVAALAVPREPEWPALLSPPPPLVIVADGVQDPGNVGAIVRSAEAGGATGVLLTGASADPWGWKALRAAMGSTFRLPVRRAPEAVRACRDLARAGVTIVVTVPRGGDSMYDVDLRGGVAVVLGSEGGGLAASVLALADRQLTIPMQGPVESLNVAVATALVVYEARRQRARPRA